MHETKQQPVLLPLLHIEIAHAGYSFNFLHDDAVCQPKRLAVNDAAGYVAIMVAMTALAASLYQFRMLSVLHYCSESPRSLACDLHGCKVTCKLDGLCIPGKFKQSLLEAVDASLHHLTFEHCIKGWRVF